MARKKPPARNVAGGLICFAEADGPLFLVLKTVDRSRDASSTADELLAAELIDWHNGSVAEQTAIVDPLADTLADDGQDADSGCLLINHTYSGLVGDNARDCGGRSVARDGYHV